MLFTTTHLIAAAMINPNNPIYIARITRITRITLYTIYIMSTVCTRQVRARVVSQHPGVSDSADIIAVTESGTYIHTYLIYFILHTQGYQGY